MASNNLSQIDIKSIEHMTDLTETQKGYLTEKGVEMVKAMNESGIFTKNDITRCISDAIDYKIKEREQEVKKKLEEEIKNENFKEESYYNGRVYIYQKYVEVDMDKKVVEQKTFKSKESYKMWLRLSEKNKKRKINN